MARSDKDHLLIAKENPSSSISEAYKTLRTNIRFSAVGRDVKVLLVTSAGPEEGRTTTAANLAVTYAQEGKKVLLIDGDLRRPAIHQIFNLPGKQGLSDLLVDERNALGVISKSDVKGLSILPAGHVPPNPSELLGSERMDTILQELRDSYEVIIIDSPPALSVTDAQIWGAMSDGVVLVIHYGKVPMEDIQTVKGSMEHVQAKILGVVLNQSAKSKKDSYYKNYYGRNSG
ncbi:CpsD/CapB family tyrosine-protein kinase [Paenibacillus daejeonensis]|uniref:CpsD/CapB family tyrosine-protein kinase n=1 Tax=Paenibacillus daejeonensis TaxID=135193 RepID=UPI0003688AA2|nr:CpsD/CapB family tyrosine-protein kinase [Paenibacillus daejeonensis]